jgi:hypothetical protein
MGTGIRAKSSQDRLSPPVAICCSSRYHTSCEHVLSGSTRSYQALSVPITHCQSVTAAKHLRRVDHTPTLGAALLRTVAAVECAADAAPARAHRIVGHRRRLKARRVIAESHAAVNDTQKSHAAVSRTPQSTMISRSREITHSKVTISNG